MTQPLVSVITPCHNAGSFVYRLLDSILAQSYGRIEMILVDDGSSDDTQRVVDPYIRRFEEKGYALKYLYQSHQGQAAAINTGLQVFTGEYLTWPDADDFLAPESVERRVAYLIANPVCGLVRCNGYFVAEAQGDIVRRGRIFNDELRFRQHLFDDLLFENIGLSAVANMVRTTALLDAYPGRRIHESRAGQNFQLLLPVASRFRSGFVDEDLCYILERPGSHSRVQRSYKEKIERLDDFVEIIRATLHHCDCDENHYNNEFSLHMARKKFQLARKHGDSDTARREAGTLFRQGRMGIRDALRYMDMELGILARRMARIFGVSRT
ncbi:glycosyltransferase family A protein [Thioalkalivibrio thiocyanodenitrificans]|uniref:glycosyltransferase family A protein n=1 Tax=Thioalkalivibrio thiocyanodenitrificans TaxID=243063 RepID=UPI00037E5F45|nr:glycosyltransferase family A protein [Thioalkalivibrio thiocyanodenitrificans]